VTGRQGRFPGLPRARRTPRPTLIVVQRVGAPAWLAPRGGATEADLVELVELAGASWTPGGTEGITVGAGALDDVVAAAGHRRWAVRVVTR
jgi:hypothetical protein